MFLTYLRYHALICNDSQLNDYLNRLPNNNSVIFKKKEGKVK